jgi:small subunit ribosomal protein S21
VNRSGDAGVVYLAPGDSLDLALAKFKRSCQTANIFRELARRTFAQSPGERRRRKRARAALRRAKVARRQREREPVDWKPARNPVNDTSTARGGSPRA